MSSNDRPADDTSEIPLLSPEAALLRPGHYRSRSANGSPLNFARNSLRPSFDAMRHRFSSILNITDVSNITVAGTSGEQASTSESISAPKPSRTVIPFPPPGERTINVWFMKGVQDLVEVAIDKDINQILFHTNLPMLAKANRDTMPAEVQLIPVNNGPSTSGQSSASPITIKKVAEEVYVHIDNYEPITFFRDKPKCVLPVDCFKAKMQSAGSQVRAAIGPLGESERLERNYAWKNTSVLTRGALKLVDTFDTERLAYFEWTGGRRSFGKLELQGTGIDRMELVVSTILALKYRPFMPSLAESAGDRSTFTLSRSDLGSVRGSAHSL